MVVLIFAHILHLAYLRLNDCRTTRRSSHDERCHNSDNGKPGDLNEHVSQSGSSSENCTSSNMTHWWASSENVGNRGKADARAEDLPRVEAIVTVESAQFAR